MILGVNPYFTSNYAEGAPVSTENKPLYDGNVDRVERNLGSKIRRQTHYLNVNNTDIPTMVQSATARTMGVSITVQVDSKDRAFDRSAEQWLEKFHELGAGELTGKHHFNSAMRAISDFEMLDGGILIRHHYNSEWECPYKYELVGVDMIDTGQSLYFPEADGSVSISGIVFNKWRQITHIWLYTDDFKTKSEKVPASDFTYYSEVWMNIAQQSAVSRLAAVLPTLDRVDQYARAELQAAIEAAKAGAYVKSTAYNEIMQIAIEKIRNMASLNEQAAEIRPLLQEMSKLMVRPFGLTPIPSGDEVQFNPQGRDGIYGQLNDTAETKMASSQGMSAISMYSKAEKANYSAIKYAAEVDQLTMNIRFDNISQKVIREIHIRAIRVGVQIGEVVNRVVYWSNQGKFNRFKYLRNVKVDIEPGKTAVANNLDLKNGLKNKKEIVETRTGIKYEDWLDQQIEAEILEYNMRKEKYEAAGVPLPTITQGSNP
jgi:capsid protein